MIEETVIEKLLNVEWECSTTKEKVIDIKSDLLNLEQIDSIIIYIGLYILWLNINGKDDYIYNKLNYDQDIIDYFNKYDEFDITYYVKKFKRNWNISKL